MDNGTWETCLFCVFRVNVEGIGVRVQPIQYGLVGKSLLLDQQIMLSLGRVGDGFQFAGGFDPAASDRPCKGVPINIVGQTPLTCLLIDQIARDSIDDKDPLAFSPVDDIDDLAFNLIGAADLELGVDHIESFFTVQDGMEGEVGKMLVVCQLGELGLLAQT